MNTIRRYAAEDAHVIYGTAYDESLGDQLRVTVIATGLSPASACSRRTDDGGAQRQRAAHRHRQPAGPEHDGRSTPAAAPMAQPDYSQLSTPSVWRNGRTQAAAKVDALASNGMDEIEIPAFLRKQAD